MYGKPTRRGAGTDQRRRRGGELHRRRHLGEVAEGAEGRRPPADLRRHRRLRPEEDIRFIWTFELKVLGSNGWMRTDIEKLLELVQEGKLKVLVDKVFPLAEAREALRVIEDREVFGKIVVAP